MVMIGWSSAAALGLIGNYASDTAAVMKLRTSPAALKTMLPVTALQPNPVEPTLVAVPEVAVTYAATPVPDVATSTRKMIATLGLSVREFPAKESALVAALHQGELVDAGATRSGWVLVTTRDGLSGWRGASISKLQIRTSQRTHRSGRVIELAARLRCGQARGLSLGLVGSQAKPRSCVPIADPRIRRAPGLTPALLLLSVPAACSTRSKLRGPRCLLTEGRDAPFQVQVELFGVGRLVPIRPGEQRLPEQA
ncbi:MAG: hypothetical protein ABL879_13350, partial [Devosia sp.]